MNPELKHECPECKGLFHQATVCARCRVLTKHLKTQKAPVAEVPCSDRVIKPDGEWTSVEITKPVESGEYLVYWDGIKVRGDRVPGVACYQVAYWREEMNKFVDPDGRKKWRTPDYWMKLPEPPKAL